MVAVQIVHEPDRETHSEQVVSCFEEFLFFQFFIYVGVGGRYSVIMLECRQTYLL
jgi:hypothetical protein